MCFIDLEKAFDRVLLHVVKQIMTEKDVENQLIDVVMELYTDNKVKIRTNGEMSKPISISQGIRQGDSLSPLLFNLIMDKIITSLQGLNGFKMGHTDMRILCYADDAVLMAESEDDLQRLLYRFNMTAKELNMKISSSKTKCMVISSPSPIRCKLQVDDNIIEQILTFNYLGVTIASYGDLHGEVSQQAQKATRVSGCLNQVIWKNKYLNIETKARIYKSVVRPVLTYAAEARADTSRTKGLLNVSEMKTLRRIVGKTRIDRVRNEEVRDTCGVEDISEWVKKRRRQWDEHVERMGEDRIVKRAKYGRPVGNRNVGRPRKRWKEAM